MNPKYFCLLKFLLASFVILQLSSCQVGDLFGAIKLSFESGNNSESSLTRDALCISTPTEIEEENVKQFQAQQKEKEMFINALIQTKRKNELGYDKKIIHIKAILNVCDYIDYSTPVLVYEGTNLKKKIITLEKYLNNYYLRFENNLTLKTNSTTYYFAFKY